MIVCGIFLVAVSLVWIVGRKKLSEDRKKMLAILTMSALLGFLYGVSNREGETLTDGRLLERRQYGEGSYEQELTFFVEEDEKELEYEVMVPQQLLTKEEQERYIEAAVEELEKKFPKANESVNHIESSVCIEDTYQDGKVDAEWSFDNYNVMNPQGEVVAEELPEEGTLVKAQVTLSCGETECMEEFYFRVFPKARDETEELIWQIGQELKEQSELQGQAYLELPETINGKQLVWSKAADYTPVKLLFFGIVLAAFVPFLEHSRQQEKDKQRARLLELEYPEVVSKIALLLGAGMTLQGALRKIAFGYEEKKKNRMVGVMPAYEEMLTTCHEIENGMGEGAAYERFGERCGRSDYRKLGNLLAQNLRKGSYGLVPLLQQEADRAFEERKGTARRYGEEAGTKLLIPMIIMLGLVMVVLMVPAVLAFQM